jgi:hypothetical protein
MAVQIKMPEKRQESSMGRRLFAMGAPVVGGAVGGPAGAALGGILGSKMSGGSTQDSLMAGAQAGVTQGLTKTAAKPEGLDMSQKLQMPALGDSAFARRFSAASQNPQVAIQEGLSVLPELPQDLREQYTEPLVKAQLALERPQLGASRGRRD